MQMLVGCVDGIVDAPLMHSNKYRHCHNTIATFETDGMLPTRVPPTRMHQRRLPLAR
jgi:hypothetical protein